MMIDQTFPQIKVEDASSWKNAEWNEENGWIGPSLVKMAALYDVWESGSVSTIVLDTFITGFFSFIFCEM